MAPAASAIAPSFSSADALLSSFQFERVLSEGAPFSPLHQSREQADEQRTPADPRALLVYLLGSAVPEGQAERAPCILKLEKTPYAPGEAPSLATPGVWSKLQTVR
jgi:m7GpppX diphosphatase